MSHAHSAAQHLSSVLQNFWILTIGHDQSCDKFQLRYLLYTLYTFMRIFIGHFQRSKHAPCLINISQFSTVLSLHIIG